MDSASPNPSRKREPIKKKLPPPTPSEAAFERLLAEFPHGALRQAQADNVVVHGDNVVGFQHATNPDVTLSLSKGDEPSEAGAFLDGLYAHAREYLDRSVHDVRDLKDEFDLPVLGEVARIQPV